LGISYENPAKRSGDRRSVTRHRCVHGRVGVKPTFEVVGVFEARAVQNAGHVGAAGAMVTDDDRLGMRVEVGEAVEKFRHRYEPGTLYPRKGELPRLSHVEQDRLLTPVEFLL
jgi:hypothetical protein